MSAAGFENRGSETSARGWCTGKTQRDGMERERGRGDGEGEHM